MTRWSDQVHWWRLLGVLLCLAQPLWARVIIPGLASSQLEPALQGRVLIEELNCAACHRADTLQAGSRKSPRLASIGARVNPDYLRAFILSPHEVKHGSLMPDVLADLELTEKRKIAESITHYLVSLPRDQDFEVQAVDTVAAERGEALFHAVGCVACHVPRDKNGNELLRDTSVPLGDLAQKYSHRSLVEFLQRPHRSRPSGRMPSLELPGNEIERIAHYLLRNTRVPGHLAFTTWRGKVYEGLDGDVEKERGGLVDDFSLETLGDVPHHTAIQYTGYLRVELAGDYTFHIEMNGGSLRLNGNDVVSEAPSNNRGPKRFAETAELEAGWNRIEFTYFHTGRDPRLRFEMEGPEFERGAIPSSRLSITEIPIETSAPFQPDAILVAQGREYFQRLGCAQCHDDVEGARQAYPSLNKLDPRQGCLAEGKGTPRFDLDAEQKQLISSALALVETSHLSDVQKLGKSLVTFNCLACHEREGVGGVSPDRQDYFTGTHESLGDQGRLPPPLTHVGAKLTKDWLAEVLMRGGRQREYLNTRMPLFGEENVGHLIDLFAKVDTLEAAPIPEVTDLQESKDAGHEMVGTSGFSCIACHDFNGQKSDTIGALDLVHVTDSLQKNWFHLYMRQPSRFHPTVIMPSYWPGGESVRKSFLRGDTGRQIEALWHFLSDGPRAKPPTGLSRQSLHLRVANEAVMCRGRGTAGYRGIGVGYPERINLAFDSEEMALRQIWRGEFANIDHGRFFARGRDRISFPAGIPFHRLASPHDHWPYKGKTDYQFPQDHGYQYRGYVLDVQKRPAFRYRYGDIMVEDYFEDRLDDDGKAFFRRTMTFVTATPQKPFFFRAASGRDMAKTNDGWRVDGLHLRLVGDYEGKIREGDPGELLIPMTLPAGRTVMTLDYLW